MSAGRTHQRRMNLLRTMMHNGRWCTAAMSLAFILVAVLVAWVILEPWSLRTVIASGSSRRQTDSCW